MFLMETRFQKINRKELQDIVNNSSDDAEDMDSLPMYILDTGFKEYDSTYGGLWQKELMMIAAPTGAGKTTFAFNIMHNILKQYERAWVIYFNPKMDRQESLTRLLGIESGYNIEFISMGRLDGISYSMLRSDAMRMATWPLIIDADPDFSLGGIIKRCRKYKAELKKKKSGMARVIFIDYLQLIDKSENSADGEKADHSAICRKLKKLAERLDATIILLCSLPENQLKEKDIRPDKKDINRYCGKGVIESIDTLMLLYGEEHYDYDYWHTGQYQMEVRVAKNGIMRKRGKMFKLCVDPRNMRTTVPEDFIGYTCSDDLPFG